MFTRPSLLTRIAVGMAVGFMIGLMAFITIPLVLADVDILLRWGVLLWYSTLGVLIAILGASDGQQAPLLPWWVQAPLIGAWMNFVLMLVIHHHLSAFGAELFGPTSALNTPLWFVGEGLLVGLIIGFVGTRIGSDEPRRH